MQTKKKHVQRFSVSNHTNLEIISKTDCNNSKFHRLLYIPYVVIVSLYASFIIKMLIFFSFLLIVSAALHTRMLDIDIDIQFQKYHININMSLSVIMNENKTKEKKKK